MEPRGTSMLMPSRIVRSPRRKTRSRIRMIGVPVLGVGLLAFDMLF